MPSISVRAMAEMIRLPASSQVRILSAQKYTKQEPQVFKIPYYQPVLTAIRNFYRSGNNESELADAIVKIQSLPQKTRRENNLRALENFKKSPFVNRQFSVRKNTKLKGGIGGVEFRLSPDLQVIDGGKEKILFFNLKQVVLDQEYAVLATEIAHWILEQNGIKTPISHIEYFDTFSGNSYKTNKRRPSTVKNLRANAKIIETLWPTL